ncbi:unnamed protein product [Brachionus calyciflorus]|uniref:Uncharacterized protein n=1 Tax=Brachionus calyciflorus TaxID=104777 RepID=A0A813W144_9BILA|nr:unnamed protein product [Brachionus calyciflorus]
MEDKSLPIFIADFSQNQEEEELDTDEDSDEDEDNLVNQILSPPKNRRQMKKDNLILKQNRKQMHSPNTNKYESKTRKPQYFNSAYNIENSSEQDFSDSLQKLQEDFNKKSRTEPFTAPASVPDRFWPDPITSDSGNAREQEKMRIENMLTEAMRGQKWSLSEPLSASLGSLAPNYSSKIPHQPIKNPQSNPKKSKKENIWKELFNHLDLNDNLCKEEDLDDKIHKIKSSISKKLNKIVNKNYMPNKNELNLELKLIAKNLLDYSKLFRNTKSLDLLLYLNSILQDKLTCSQNIERIYLNSQIDEGLKREQGEKIWKELFYYFEFNDNSTNEFEINERIRKIRSEIPQKINNILTVNYSSIKNEMDFEIRYSMKSFLDYSNLYGNKRYMDRLCYLNLLVQEKLNSIHNIERLYPSIRSLKQDQVDYSDPKFESSAKSLLLWNKIVEDLMVKSDQLGKPIFL